LLVVFPSNLSLLTPHPSLPTPDMPQGRLCRRAALCHRQGPPPLALLQQRRGGPRERLRRGGLRARGRGGGQRRLRTSESEAADEARKPAGACVKKGGRGVGRGVRHRWASAENQETFSHLSLTYTCVPLSLIHSLTRSTLSHTHTGLCPPRLRHE
jgi:hypothetical protein